MLNVELIRFAFDFVYLAGRSHNISLWIWMEVEDNHQRVCHMYGGRCCRKSGHPVSCHLYKKKTLLVMRLALLL